MMHKNFVVIGAPALLPLLQADEGSSIPWWVWILIIAVLLLLLFIGLVRQQEPGPPLPKEEALPPREEAPVMERVKDIESEAPPEPVETEPEPVMPAEPDDLKRIEGIGPKISGLLQDAGISSFAQLAETSAERLNQLLDDANIHIADPTTWPDQAKLAAAEKWDELEQLQESLKGGRRD